MVEKRRARIVPRNGSPYTMTLSLVGGDLRRPRVPEDDVAQCGGCGRYWDDGQSTTWTPAPSGRCPFEYEHDDDNTDESLSAVRDMPSPEADALDRIAEMVREGVWERYETGKRPWTFQGAVSDILRETGRL